MFFKNASARSWLSRYLRYVDYIGAAQLYLKDNYLLKEPLKVEHIKDRVLGHWGTVPGLNFIYANLNRLIVEKNAEMLLIVGPGHGAPAVLANLLAEDTLKEFYPAYPRTGEGMGKLIHDFSWPHTPFPSHVTPSVPGSILEGGELGYSLATAYGAVMDNPDLIAAVVVGDGESETGAIATAWHSNKFLNPKTSGAVLPIVHINGYKISNPTIFGRMDDEELTALFKGYGYLPLIVSGKNADAQMMKAMDQAYARIREIQAQARSGKQVLKPQWPVILLRSPKGWRGIQTFHGHAVEGSFHSHGIPLEGIKKEPVALAALESWLRSYKIEELVDAQGRPKQELLKFVPKGKQRLGMNPHTIGGNLLKALKFPASERHEMKFEARGCEQGSSMEVASLWIRDVFKNNPKNFRLFCPDEAVSNRLETVFQQTQRAFMWPIEANDEHMAQDGRVMEMLSEHTLQAWYMGYLLTGRHGLFVSYEAFTTIITSMVDQHAKFLKQSFKVAWRKPVGSAVYINSSLGWRQDHNGYSHQNPSFVSNVLQKHGEFCQIYYPSDANSMLVALEEALSARDKICVIVAGKTPLPQWLTLEEARKQAKTGIAVWDWVTGKKAAKNPDVILASAGDYMTQEALYAVLLCQELAPEIKLRYVNVSELTALCLGDGKGKNLDFYFTKDKPVVFNYHGYINDVEQILWPHMSSERVSLHGYREEGSTTTPFDLKVVNKVSFYHLAMDIFTQAAKTNRALAKRLPALIKEVNGRIKRHHRYIEEHGDDPQDVKSMCWMPPQD